VLLFFLVFLVTRKAEPAVQHRQSDMDPAEKYRFDFDAARFTNLFIAKMAIFIADLMTLLAVFLMHLAIFRFYLAK
jgi:hypothetical protein